jgi:lipid-A-disaccharide synthase
MAERRICPEFVQDEATPENLAGAVIGLLLEPERMLRMKEDLRAAVRLLGEPGGAARTARMVVDLARGANRER